MLDRRMIGRIVYDKYEFRKLNALSRDLYTYLLLNCDNDGVCDRLYETMTLNKNSFDDLRNLIESQFVYPLLNEQSPNMIVWLPDFCLINQIKQPKGYAPSIYRADLRKRYPWAPVLIVWDDKKRIRTDIEINNNDNLPPDPRTGIPYKTPKCQIPAQCKTEKSKELPLGQPNGLPSEKEKKIKSKKINFNQVSMTQNYGDLEDLERELLAN